MANNVHLVYKVIESLFEYTGLCFLSPIWFETMKGMFKNDKDIVQLGASIGNITYLWKEIRTSLGLAERTLIIVIKQILSLIIFHIRFVFEISCSLNFSKDRLCGTIKLRTTCYHQQRLGLYLDLKAVSETYRWNSLHLVGPGTFEWHKIRLNYSLKWSKFRFELQAWLSLVYM